MSGVRIPAPAPNRILFRDARIGRWNAGLNSGRYPHIPGECGLRRRRTVARSDYLCLVRALSQSTVVTEPQPPHCTLVRLLSTYRRLFAGVTAPGPVNRALGANELAEDAHLHSTKLPIDLVGQQRHPGIDALTVGSSPCGKMGKVPDKRIKIPRIGSDQLFCARPLAGR